MADVIVSSLAFRLFRRETAGATGTVAQRLRNVHEAVIGVGRQSNGGKEGGPVRFRVKLPVITQRVDRM